jgi:glycosyltransferase involved in cell wall biosynthesis
VALFLPSLAVGGAERAVLGAARLLHARGHDVALVLGVAEGPLLDEIPTDVPVVVLGQPRTSRAVPALVRYLRAARPSTLIPGMIQASVTADLAATLARTGTVVVPRLANTHSAVRQGVTTPWERLLVAASARAYRRAPLLIAPSQGVADDVVASAGVDAARVRIAPNPVVDQRVLSAAQRPASHRFFAPGAPPVVLSVGRLVWQKDIVGLVEAFAAVQARTAATLLVLGDGPERSAVVARARELGIADVVDAPGFDPDPFPAMAQAGAYVLASRYEGSPAALIQALACGTPIVATDCPSGPREVLDGGRWGTLVPVGDRTALADAITQQLGRGRVDRPASAWARWSEGASADAYEALVREAGALAGRGATR